jgi:hypothetical protein
MKLTDHVRKRMSERGITEANIRSVLNAPLGDPMPGQSPGSVVLEGLVGANRCLKVVCSSLDPVVIITAYWA